MIHVDGDGGEREIVAAEGGITGEGTGEGKSA